MLLLPCSLLHDPALLVLQQQFPQSLYYNFISTIVDGFKGSLYIVKEGGHEISDRSIYFVNYNQV
jgi:hypothetical protein